MILKAESIPDEGREEHGEVLDRDVVDELKTSYLTYSMSVIVGRALPDVRDGLKPVHRRILYSMYESGLTSKRPYRKSARVVGEVLGKYHPHGDAAVYDTLVRMAQPFSMRYPLVDGQGNFGSLDGDSAAAMRYTEARLSKIAEEMLVDIEEETVDFVPNYDGTLKEPTVLPARLPNLLVNGTTGIAVGMATSMPPHNLREVVDALLLVLDNPEADLREIMNIIPGPDFPTGGIIVGKAPIMEAYHTGRGRIRVRAKTRLEVGKRSRIVVEEIPYQVNKANMLEKMAELIKAGDLQGIVDLRDESDKEGVRIVIELGRDANAEIVLRNLFAHTDLEVTYSIINLALVNNEPRVLSLKELLKHFLDHRRQVVRRRTEYRLRKSRERLHILEGLRLAIERIDETIKIIRSSSSPEEARGRLMERIGLSERQANAVLQMQLQRLTALERGKLEGEIEELTRTIRELTEILQVPGRLERVIREELVELKKRYGDERRTQIIEGGEEEVTDEDLIQRKDLVISLTAGGYVKSITLDAYRSQRRGGKGVRGVRTKEEDHVTHLFIASTHDYILFFTDKGKVYWLKGYQIPETPRGARGKPLIQLLRCLDPGEVVTTAIPVESFSKDEALAFVTQKGTVKRTSLEEFSRPRTTGIRALLLDEDDTLISVLKGTGESDILIATRWAQAVRFPEREARCMGRAARGVRGVRLAKGDEVVSATLVSPGDTLFSVTEYGYGKLTREGDYRRTRRGAKGVIAAKINMQTGGLVGVEVCPPESDILLSTDKGMVIRIPSSDVPLYGRNSRGVRIMRVDEGEKITDFTILPP
ncbi:MAG: DNA gyrase subunit A [Thermoplasmata archaeon]|mgnify:CR=1 FL=1|nr:MAG: DNA gyrase subunit A [Thermoplasmata archaeon]RLF76273.1 MAG: DNA gyrase subunit A [Thermoplasmata archaeon]HDD59649.1 DNA gyrase subunit A [Euryarchaeota archaeon]